MADGLPRVVAGMVAVAPVLDARDVLDALWLAATATEEQVAERDPSTAAALPRTGSPEESQSRPGHRAEHVAPVRPAQSLVDSPSAPGGRVAVSHLRTAAGRALPRALDLARALRPFKRRWPQGRRHAFDIGRTIAAYARTGVLTPLFAPAEERWFDVDVVADRSVGMRVWDETIDELLGVLRNLGTFRTARRWDLVERGGRLLIYDPIRRTTASPRLLRSPNARRLILIVSDSRAPRWRDRPLWTQLREWAGSTPTAVVNPLPTRLWRYDSIGLPWVRVGPGTVGGANSRLSYEHSLPLAYLDAPRDHTWLPLPVVGLTPSGVAAWAGTLMRADPAGCGALLVGPAPPPPDDDDDVEDGARDRPVPDGVRDFRHFASPAAVRLAVLCSPYTLANLAVVNLIRQYLVPEATVSDVAELVSSGLFEPTELERGVLVHRAGVRDRLTALLAKNDAWRTHELLIRHISDNLRGRAAFVADRAEQIQLPADLAPFVDASRDTLRLLGIALPDDDRLFLPVGGIDGPDGGLGTAAARPPRTTAEAAVFVTYGLRDHLAGAMDGPQEFDLPGRDPVRLWFWNVDGHPGAGVPGALLDRPGAIYLVHADSTALRESLAAAVGDPQRVLVVDPVGSGRFALGSETLDVPGIVATVARSVRTSYTLSAAANGVREDLAALARSAPVIAFDEFAGVARRAGLTLAEAADLARTLTQLGQLLHVGDAVVLDRHWLMRGVHAVHQDPRTERAGGVVDPEVLVDAWRAGAGPLPDDPARTLVALMEAVGGSCRLPGGGILVPVGMPPGPPRLPWSDARVATESARYRLGSPLPGFGYALISQYVGGLATEAWRGGMFLRDPDTGAEARVQAIDDSELEIEVRARRPGPFLDTILAGASTLLRRRWPALTYEVERRPLAAPNGPAEARTPWRYYFYLSWERGSTGDDRGIREFFERLRARVAANGDADPEWRIGFCDGGDDLARLGTALGGAEVLVLLCSEDYRTGMLPMAELAAFRARAERAPAHILPVLWTPTSPRTVADLGDPFDWAGDAPEYRRLGLEALGTDRAYKPVYETLVDRLAGRIVALAEGDPIGRSEARITPQPVEPTHAFLIAVVAPARSEQWRPFGVPVADQALNAADRLGLPARVDERGLVLDGPGVVLLDPWILDREGGDDTLAAVVAGIRAWNAVLVVAGEQPDDLVRQVTHRLQPTGAMVKIAGEARELEELVRSTVNNAWKRYLRWGPVYPPGVGAPRVRL